MQVAKEPVICQFRVKNQEFLIILTRKHILNNSRCRIQSHLAYLRTLCQQKKMRKDTRDCKDVRATHYTYYISCL